jgi:hypothetical protein
VTSLTHAELSRFGSESRELLIIRHTDSCTEHDQLTWVAHVGNLSGRGGDGVFLWLIDVLVMLEQGHKRCCV